MNPEDRTTSAGKPYQTCSPTDMVIIALGRGYLGAEMLRITRGLEPHGIDVTTSRKGPVPPILDANGGYVPLVGSPRGR